MKKFLVFAAALWSASFAFGAEKAPERLMDSARVIHEIMTSPGQGIPQDLLNKAYCVVIVPGMKKAAFIVGGEFGKGYAICRRSHGEGWGAPAAIRMEGGSFGFQIGGSDTDVVMLVMNEHGMRMLDKSKFTLGADASVAAGPVGRSTTANTDATMNAEILSWSRSKGVFAGIALNGATLRPDRDDNAELYGRPLGSHDILMRHLAAPAAARPLISELDRYSMRKQG